MGMPARRARLHLPAAALLGMAGLGSARAQSTAPSAAAGAGRLPLETFFGAPSLTGARLSPSGQSLAIRLAADGQRARLGVIDLATMKPTVAGAFDDADIGRFHWVDDRRLVFDTWDAQSGDGDVDAAPGLFAADADGSGFRQLADRGRAFVRSGSLGRELLPWNTFLLDGAPSPGPGRVYAVSPQEMSRSGADFFRLLVLDTTSGRSEEVETPARADGWWFDGGGVLRVVTERRDRMRSLLVRDGAGAPWRKVAEFDLFGFSEALVPKALTSDGQLYVTALAGGDLRALHRLDPSTGRLSEQPVLAASGFDVEPSLMLRQGRLAGIRYHVDGEVTQWLDPAAQAVQGTVDGALKATSNRISWPAQAADPRFVLVEAFADVQPTLTYLFDRPARRLLKIGEERPVVKPGAMSTMDFVRITARDGLSIPAYLTMPQGGPRRGLPLVVLVHGGPFARGGTWRWQDEVQFFASRGCAVLQPEFRGSTGFGTRHFRAGWKEWGGAMQRDLVDAARWAIGEGVADPRRVAIAGASYGGYAALMGVIQDPDLFRCAVSSLAPTDLELLATARWSDMSDLFRRHGYPTLVGDPATEGERLRAVSPLRQAAKVARPVLLGYGAADVRVPIEHGRRLREALRAANKVHEYVEYPSEGHGWRTQATRLDWWRRVDDFLARHLLGDPA